MPINLWSWIKGSLLLSMFFVLGCQTTLTTAPKIVAYEIAGVPITSYKPIASRVAVRHASTSVSGQMQTDLRASVGGEGERTNITVSSATEIDMLTRSPGATQNGETGFDISFKILDARFDHHGSQQRDADNVADLFQDGMRGTEGSLAVTILEDEVLVSGKIRLGNGTEQQFSEQTISAGNPMLGPILSSIREPALYTDKTEIPFALSEMPFPGLNTKKIMLRPYGTGIFEGRRVLLAYGGGTFGREGKERGKVEYQQAIDIDTGIVIKLGGFFSVEEGDQFIELDVARSFTFTGVPG